MKLKEDQSRTVHSIKKGIKEQQVLDRGDTGQEKERNWPRKKQKLTPTSLQNESKRQCYSKYRREQRSKMSCQKKQAIQEKDRKRNYVESTPEFPSTPGQLEIPTTPTSHSNMVKSLVDKITPRRQNILWQVGIRLIDERKAVEATISGVKKPTLSIKGKRSNS